jgi:hypothetical protein
MKACVREKRRQMRNWRSRTRMTLVARRLAVTVSWGGSFPTAVISSKLHCHACDSNLGANCLFYLPLFSAIAA